MRSAEISLVEAVAAVADLAVRATVHWRPSTRIVHGDDGIQLLGESDGVTVRGVDNVVEAIRDAGIRSDLIGGTAAVGFLRRVWRLVEVRIDADDAGTLILRQAVREVTVRDTGIIAAIPHPHQLLSSSADGYVLEHVEAFARIITQDPAPLLALLHGGAANETTTRVGRLLGYLLSEPDATLARRRGELHDLLFHRRSRSGTDLRYGGTFPHGHVDEPPVLAPVPHGPLIELPVPDQTVMITTDPPLVSAMERRRSRREFGDPMDLSELSTFLFRTARTIATFGPDAATRYHVARRVNPSGGGMYELETYLTVESVRGLESGCYKYVPEQHSLVALKDDVGARRSLLDDIVEATGIRGRPGAIVNLVSRFDRLTWKYESISYATTLKNVGVAYGSMYLVGEALGLATTAVGGGDSPMVSRLYRLEETMLPVGEFVVGRRGADPTEDPHRYHYFDGPNETEPWWKE